MLICPLHSFCCTRLILCFHPSHYRYNPSLKTPAHPNIHCWAQGLLLLIILASALFAGVETLGAGRPLCERLPQTKFLLAALQTNSHGQVGSLLDYLHKCAATYLYISHYSYPKRSFSTI